MSKKVLVAMSGGVDSTYTAICLKEQGYNIVGVTFKIDDSNNTNNSILDAKSVCDKLGIEHVIVDYSFEFRESVINYFVDSYKSGNTPNPCVVCNKCIKFGMLNELRIKLRCDYVATGHYVRCEKIGNDYYIKKAVNIKKDQSYFLNQVDKSILPFYIFPLGEISSKDEVREFVKSRGFEIASKKESQEICFVENDKLSDFLNEYIPAKQGNILDEEGRVLGTHMGAVSYTIGQRRGLGVSSEKVKYVLKTDIKENTVYLGDEEKLFKKEVQIIDVNIFGNDFLNSELYGKIRYRTKEAKIDKIEINNGAVNVYFNEPQKSITPGQYLVIYHDDYLVLGGKIV